MNPTHRKIAEELRKANKHYREADYLTAYTKVQVLNALANLREAISKVFEEEDKRIKQESEWEMLKDLDYKPFNPTKFKQIAEL